MKKTNNLKEEKAQALLSAYMNGDQQAFFKLYDMYAGMMLNYGACITSDTELVKDCMQDVFVKFLSKRDNLQINKLTSYLITAFRNRLLDAFRRGANFTENPLDECHIMALEPGVESKYIAMEREERDSNTLDRLLTVLSPRQREVFKLYYLENREYDEISAIMNINYNSLRNLVHRGMVKMRSALVS